MIDLLIRGGTIVDGQSVGRGSIAVQGSRIVARYADGAELPQAKRVIEAGHHLVLPGIVDPHVHFYGEGIGEFSRLAAQGGVTTFIGMIRGGPEQKLSEILNAQRVEGETTTIVDFAFHTCIYDRPDTIPQLGELAERGYASFKMFLAYKRRGMMSSEPFLFDAMREIARIGGIALVHSENGETVDRLEQEAITAGRREPAAYAPTRPPEAEASAIDVVALSAAISGCPAYIVHVSSALGLAAVDRARARGVPLWAETCPQYILLDDGDLQRCGPMARIAPPLRSPADRRALGTALSRGVINSVGSDHASYSWDAKNKGRDDIFAAPVGMPGAPTHLPAMLTWAVEHGVPLPVLIHAMSTAPAAIFGLGDRKGTLNPGADADIVLVDSQTRREVTADLWTNVCPPPLLGLSLTGWPTMTVSRGEIVWDGGAIVAQPGRGRLLPQQRR